MDVEEVDSTAGMELRIDCTDSECDFETLARNGTVDTLYLTAAPQDLSKFASVAVAAYEAGEVALCPSVFHVRLVEGDGRTTGRVRVRRRMATAQASLAAAAASSTDGDPYEAMTVVKALFHSIGHYIVSLTWESTLWLAASGSDIVYGRLCMCHYPSLLTRPSLVCSARHSVSAYSDSLDRLVVVDPLRGRDGAAALQFAMAKGTIHTLNINWSSRVLEEDEEIVVREYPPTSHRHRPHRLLCRMVMRHQRHQSSCLPRRFRRRGLQSCSTCLLGAR